jgi:YidC/Oxa1 family membrane protein insertase
MSYLYHTFFFDPLYNLLVLFSKIFPWADAGIIIIVLTILVRLILYPLSRKAVVTQVRMSEIAPELNEIKEKYKDKPEEQARRTLALYREKGVNPFSGIFMILIQIPLILALYQIFIHFPQVNTDLLYSFVSAPASIDTVFLGIDITGKSILLAFLAAASTYAQFHVSSKVQSAPKGNSFGDNLARSMQTQMKYVFPVIMFFIAYTISGVIGLYFFTTNVFGVVQEIFVRRKIKTTSA